MVSRFINYIPPHQVPFDNCTIILVQRGDTKYLVFPYSPVNQALLDQLKARGNFTRCGQDMIRYYGRPALGLNLENVVGCREVVQMGALSQIQIPNFLTHQDTRMRTSHQAALIHNSTMRNITITGYTYR